MARIVAIGRRWVQWTVAFFCVIAITACNDVTPATVPAVPRPAANAAPTSLATVALGDSVPSGGACNCTPFPERTATSLTKPGVRQTTIANYAVAGYTTQDVLTQLSTNRAAMSAVSGADVVEVEIGANDVQYSDSCGTSVACYQPAFAPIRSNLAAIIERIDALAGRDVLVVLLDYWSAWLGGKYAAAHGAAYVSTAAAVTADVNTIIRNLANRTGAAYVDLRAAFKGADYTDDETDYLADDGDHPNADGHQLAADALTDVISRTLNL